MWCCSCPFPSTTNGCWSMPLLLTASQSCLRPALPQHCVLITLISSFPPRCVSVKAPPLLIRPICPFDRLAAPLPCSALPHLFAQFLYRHFSSMPYRRTQFAAMPTHSSSFRRNAVSFPAASFPFLIDARLFHFIPHLVMQSIAFAHGSRQLISAALHSHQACQS